MKKVLFIFVATLTISFPARALFDFGQNAAILAQILANAIKQLAELEQILRTAKGNLDLMKDVYRGIHDAMEIMKTSPNVDPGIYRDLVGVDALRKIEELYGKIPKSSESQIQSDADQGVAEAISFNNELYDYTKQIDAIGEEIKRFSRALSPAGASKLTAESLGVMLHVMDQMLRAQGKAVKLQALQLAMQNHKDKSSVAHQVKTSDDITRAMKYDRTEFKLPRL